MELAALEMPRIGTRDALFLDFDGTLVELAERPDAVQVARAVPVLLQHASARLGGALAIISGRPLEQIDRYLRPFRSAAAGIHGLERRSAGGNLLVAPRDSWIEAVRPLLKRFAALSPGVVLEDKGLSLALHYRAKPGLGPICIRVAAAIVGLSHQRLALRTGKMVVELMPRDTNKGRAIIDFLSEPAFRTRRPIFVGDDETDEEGFDIVNRLGGVSIHVGSSPGTAAKYRFANVAAVIGWLEDFAAPAPARHLDRSWA
jgi:trehalose 6-phosphate phosphatase